MLALVPEVGAAAAVGALLQARGACVHLPPADEHDIGARVIVVAGHGAVARFSTWSCRPQFFYDWERTRRVEDEHEHASYLLWWAVSQLRSGAKASAYDLLASIADDRDRVSVLQVVHWHWARWWDSLLADGHTVEAAQMLLELSVPGPDLRMLMRDVTGRPAAATDAHTPPSTVASSTTCA